MTIFVKRKIEKSVRQAAIFNPTYEFYTVAHICICNLLTYVLDAAKNRSIFLHDRCGIMREKGRGQFLPSSWTPKSSPPRLPHIFSLSNKPNKKIVERFDRTISVIPKLFCPLHSNQHIPFVKSSTFSPNIFVTIINDCAERAA